MGVSLKQCCERGKCRGRWRGYGYCRTTFTHAQLLAGEVVYRHDGGETTSSDAIAFIVNDGTSDSGSGHVDVSPVDDSPTLSAVATPIVVLEGGGYTLSASELLAADVDTASSEWVYRLSSAASAGSVEVGGVAIDPGTTFTQAQLLAGEVVYRHDDGETSSDSIAFIVNDGNSDSGSATLNIDVSPVDDSPTLSAVATPIVVLEGGSYTLSASELLAADVDTASSEWVYRLSSAASAGSVEVGGVAIDPGTTFTQAQLLAGEVVYRHDGGETSSDSIAFIVNDGNSDSGSATVNVRVSPVNDTPELAVTLNTVAENESGAIAGTITSSDADPDDVLTLSVDDPRFQVQNGVLSLLANQTLDFEAEPQVELNVSVVDSAGAQFSQLLTLTVLDRNDVPEVVETIDAMNGSGFQLPDSTFTDGDNDTLSYSATLENGEALPAWLRFDSVERTFAVVDTSAVVPELLVLIIADDSRGGQSSFSMILRFEPPVAAAAPVSVVEEFEFTALVPASSNGIFVEAAEPERSSKAERSASGSSQLPFQIWI